MRTPSPEGHDRRQLHQWRVGDVGGEEKMEVEDDATCW